MLPRGTLGALGGLLGSSEAVTKPMDRDFGNSEKLTGPIDRDVGALWELLVAFLTASPRSRSLQSSKSQSSELSGG